MRLVQGLLLLTHCAVDRAVRISSFQESGKSRPECRPQQCMDAMEKLSWDSVKVCQSAGAADCTYVTSVAYEDDDLDDFDTAPWEDSLIFTGIVPGEVAPKGDVSVTSEVSLSLYFKYTGTSLLDESRCIYMVSLTRSKTLSPSGVEYPAEYACAREGLPVAFQLSNNEQVGFLLLNETASNFTTMRLVTYYLTQPQLMYLVQPTKNYELERVALQGTISYVLGSTATDTAWMETSVTPVTATFAADGQEELTCDLCLGSDTQEVNRMLKICRAKILGSGATVRGGLMRIDSMVQTPRRQRITEDSVSVGIDGSSLIGQLNLLRADSISVKMKAAAYEDCIISVYERSDESDASADKLTGGADVSYREATLGKAIIPAGSRDFSIEDISLSQSWLQLSFTSDLSRCGVSINQIWLKGAQVSFTLDYASYWEASMPLMQTAGLLLIAALLYLV